MKASLVCALLLCLGATGRPSAAATPPPTLPSLRHLVFSFNVSIKDELEQRLEGVVRSDTGMGGGTGLVSSGDRNQVGASAAGKGTIVCDVVAATQDGGLVVDVSEDSVERRRPTVRVAILDNGRLSFPPDSQLNDEETVLLGFLSRGLLGGTQRDTGSQWSVEDGAGDYSAKTTYRVAAAPSDGAMKLDVAAEYRQRGARSYTTDLNAKLDYDAAKLVPTKALVTSKTRRETPQQYQTTDESIDLALLEDSFAKAKP